MKTFLFGLLALPLTLIAAGTVTAAGAVEKATFAGGCFWCMEHPFDALPGVLSVTAGYTGGQKKNPTYKEVSAGGTGHAEAVQIVYDPSKITLRDASRRLLAQHRSDREGPPVLRYRQPVPGGDFLPHGGTAPGGVAVEGGAGKNQDLQGTGGHRDRPRRRILSGGGVPPALLQEEPDPLQLLQDRMRPGPAAQGALGKRGRGERSSGETAGGPVRRPYPPQPQEGFEPVSHPERIAAAHPTPGVTEIAFVGQFIAHAPHSMQASRSRIRAFPAATAKTP